MTLPVRLKMLRHSFIHNTGNGRTDGRTDVVKRYRDAMHADAL